MSLLKIPTAFNIDLEFQITNLGRRILAYFIDFLIIVLYTLLISKILIIFNSDLTIDRFNEENKNLVFILGFVFIGIPVFFYSVMTEIFMNGQTVGKRLLGMKVVSIDGNPVRLSQYITRWIVKFYEWPVFFSQIYFMFLVSNEATEIKIMFWIISTGMLGAVAAIVAAISINSQRIGDIFAGTAVVNVSTNLDVNDTVFMDIRDSSYVVTFPNVLKLSDRDINTIKSVLTEGKKMNNFDVINRVAQKVEQVLGTQTSLFADEYLHKILSDYNYLATEGKDKFIF